MPRSYGLPLLDGGTLDYELVDIPFPVELLTRARGEVPGTREAEQAAKWVEGVLAGRAGLAEALLTGLGAPGVGEEDRRQGLVMLGKWLQGWFPVVARPYLRAAAPGETSRASDFLRIDPQYRMGPVLAQWPSREGYSPIGDVLLHSLVIDLASFALSPGVGGRGWPTWSVQSEGGWRHLVVESSVPVWAPLERIRNLLLQSAGPPRGEHGRRLRRRQAETLAECRDQVTDGVVPADADEIFSLGGHRTWPWFVVRRQRDVGSSASPRVTKAVTTLRSTGLFSEWRHSDADLAVAAEASWRSRTRRHLPRGVRNLWISLILMDTGRTWFEDIDVGPFGPGDDVYSDTLFAVGEIGGRGFGGISDQEEDWQTDPGMIDLNIRWRRRRHRFQVPATPSGVLQPSLFQQLNAVLSEDGPRLWFLDLGATIGTVVRLTRTERENLTAATGLALSTDPPSWWQRASATGLASLPSGRSDPFLLGAPLRNPMPVSDAPEGVEENELLAVSVTDREDEGKVVFQVFVAAAEYIRDSPGEEALHARVTARLQAVPGVATVEHPDREVWELGGNPQETALHDAAVAAVETVIRDFPENN